MIYHCNPNGGNIYLELMVLLVSIVNVVGRSEEEYKGRASEWSNPSFFNHKIDITSSSSFQPGWQWWQSNYVCDCVTC